MYAIFIIFSIVIEQFYAQCTAGCLICANNACNFCDFTNSYVYNGVSCDYQPIVNCTVADTYGNCLTCSNQTYLDTAVNKCIFIGQVPKTLICASFASATACSYCQTNFTLSNNVCVNSTLLLPNCLITNNSTSPAQCIQCAANFIPTSDNRACIQIISQPRNCAGLTIYNCSSCATGFILDLNGYQNKVYVSNTQTTRQFLVNQITYDMNFVYNQGIYPTCFASLISNCQVYLNAQQCSICNSGYFLNATLLCQPFPSPGIANCVIYTSATTCFQCKAGFFPSSSSVCSAVTPIPNCLTYDQTNPIVTCTLCSASYFISNNICTSRENFPILNCLTYQAFSDSCLNCQLGYQVTSDNLKCLFATPLCISYLQSTASTTQLSCTNCTIGYYFASGNGCVIGTIPNCYIYAGSQNQCTVCVNGYYLQNPTSCVQHNPIALCGNYSQTAPNTCAQCVQNYFTFNILNVCKPAITIANCSLLASSTTCANCSDGFYLVSGLCQQIVSPVNCLQISGTLCIKCAKNYYINNGVCVTPPVFFLNNCETYNADGLTSLVNAFCTSCVQNAYPINFADSYACQTTAAISSSNIYTNCLSYQTDGLGNFNCTRCFINFYVQPSLKSCAQNCPTGYIVKMVETFNLGVNSAATTYSFFKVSRTGICTLSTANFQNCQSIYPDLFTHNTAPGEVTYNCGVCLSSFLPVIVVNQVIYINSALNALQDTSPFSTNPVSTYPGVQCKSASSLVFNGLNAVINNCDYYYTSGSYWGCYKCMFGFTGPIINFPSLATGYILSCTTFIQDCSTTQFQIFILQKAELSVFQIPLNALYSCHSCVNANQIPYIALDFTNGISYPPLAPWGLNFTVTNITSSFGTSAPDGTTYRNYLTTFYKTGSWSPANFCAYNVRTSFRMISATDYGTVPNCGLGILNVNGLYSAFQATSTNPTSMSNTAVYCFACLPRFSPIRVDLSNTVAPMMVHTCQTINNCASSIWFNACSSCSPNFAYQWSTTSQTTNFGACIATTDPNCLVMGATICQFCVKGYFLNPDKKCEVVQILNCSDPFQQFALIYPVSPATDSHALGFYLQPQGPSCVSCNAGFTSILLTTQQYLCTTSQYLTNQVFVSNSAFTSNCLQYSLNVLSGNIVCGTCKTNFMTTVTGKCIATLANCVIATDTGTCSVCLPNFVNLLAVCVTPNIANCAQYNFNPSGSVQVCQVCLPGYFWSSPNCVVGNIPNCLVLSSASICSKCAPAFYPITIPGPKSYCFPIPASLQCQTTTPDFANNNFACETCQVGYFPVLLTTFVTTNMCLGFIPVPNCQNYSNSANPATSNFTCSNCTANYFLNGVLCVLRTLNISNCINYSITSDTCSNCSSSFFLNPNGTACVAFPLGIAGCIKYSNLTTCIQCDINMFLNSTFCSNVPTTNLITNCTYYKDVSTCSYCSPPSVVTGSICAFSQAVNCSTFASTTACATCPSLFGFIVSSGITNCSPISDPNCLVFNMTYPFPCLTCKTNFYPLLGLCTALVTPITNCVISDSLTTCTQCSPGSVLSSDRKSCITALSMLSNFDVNCAQMSILQTPVCNKCSPGFYFANLTCIPCSKASLTNGCYACNSKNSSNCLMCSPGFFMNSQGSCILSASPNNSSGNNSNTSNSTSNGTLNQTNFTTNTTNFVGLISVLWWSLIWIKLN